VEQEERERALYKENIRKWRDDQAKLDAASRTSHQTVQSYHNRQSPQTKMPQPAQRPYRSGFFDNLAADSFDDEAKKSVYGQYSTPNQSYQQYRHYYASSAGKFLNFTIFLWGLLIIFLSGG